MWTLDSEVRHKGSIFKFIYKAEQKRVIIWTTIRSAVKIINFNPRDNILLDKKH